MCGMYFEGMYMARAMIIEKDTKSDEDQPKRKRAFVEDHIKLTYLNIDKINDLHGSETVLLVEDEVDMLNLLERVLLAKGYTVLKAATVKEAMSICNHLSVPIHLLVCDIVMPRMCGPELANKLKKIHTELKVLLFSGYVEHPAILGRHLLPGVDYLLKPFTPELFLRTIRSALNLVAPNTKMPIQPSVHTSR